MVSQVMIVSVSNNQTWERNFGFSYIDLTLGTQKNHKLNPEWTLNPSKMKIKLHYNDEEIIRQNLVKR